MIWNWNQQIHMFEQKQKCNERKKFKFLNLTFEVDKKI